MTQQDIRQKFYARERMNANEFLVTETAPRCRSLHRPPAPFCTHNHQEALFQMERLLASGAEAVTLYCNGVRVLTVQYHLLALPSCLLQSAHYPVPGLLAAELHGLARYNLTDDIQSPYGVK